MHTDHHHISIQFKLGSRLLIGINTGINWQQGYVIDMIVWTSPPFKWWGRNLLLRTRIGGTLEDRLEGHDMWLGSIRCQLWNFGSCGTCMGLNQGKEIHAVLCILGSIRFWYRVTFYKFFCNGRWDESLHPLINVSSFTSRCRVFGRLIILELPSIGVGSSGWLTPFM